MNYNREDKTYKEYTENSNQEPKVETNKREDKSDDETQDFQNYNWNSTEDIRKNFRSLVEDLIAFISNLNHESLNRNFKLNLGWFKLGLTIVSYILIVSIASTIFRVTLLVPGFNFFLYGIGLFEFIKVGYKPISNLFVDKNSKSSSPDKDSITEQETKTIEID